MLRVPQDCLPVTVPRLVRAVDDLRPQRDLAPIGIGARQRFGLRGRELAAYDGQLRIVASRKLRTKDDSKLLAATDDLTMSLLSTPEACWLHRDRKPMRIDVPAADAAVFLGVHRALVTAPELLISSGGQGSRGSHFAYLIELDGGSVLHRIELPAADAGAFLTVHPGGTVLADLGEGQDGSTVYELSVESATLKVREALTNVVVADVHAVAGHVLLTPHPSFSDVGVRVLAWPSADVLATLQPGDLEIDDEFQMYGAYLGANRILLATYETGMFMTDSVLRDPVRLSFPDHLGEPESFLVTDERHFVTSHWVNGAEQSFLWST